MTDLIYELLYVIAVTCGVYSFFSPVRGVVFFVIQLIVVVIAVMFKKSGWIGRLVVAGVVITLAALVALLMRSDAVYERLIAYSDVLWLAVTGPVSFIIGELMASFRPVRIAVSVFAAASLVLYVVLTSTGVIIAGRGTAGIGGVVAGASGLTVYVDKLYVTAVFFLVILCLAEEIQRSWHKSGYTEHTGHLVFISPFLVAAMLLLYISPSPDEAYDWGFVRDMYRVAYEKIQDFSLRFSFGRGEEAEAQIGFSGRGSFAGDIERGERDVMVLSGITGDISCVRLTGKTFSSFDGRQWTDEDESTDADVMLDTLMLISSVDAYTDSPKDYIRKATVGIKYADIRTTYVFAPLKSLSDSPELSESGIRYIGGDMQWASNRAFKTTYSVPFYRMNMDHEIFDEYLDAAMMPTREEFERVAEEFAPAGTADSGLKYDDLLAHRERIYEMYTEPPVLSEELKEYLESVIDGGGIGTDDPALSTREKLEKIEQLLRSFEYTEGPGDIPEYVQTSGDFLDYFMLESKRGYCSHFATAFVLLARAEGVPARYVQGYMVYPGGHLEVNVNTSMAHAWPEVYFEGAGWVPYEPTPIQEVRSYWRTADELAEMYRESQGAYPAGMSDVPSDEEPEASEGPDDEPGLSIPWFVFVIPVLAGLIFVSFFLFVGRLIGRRRFMRMSADERFMATCRYDLGILKRLKLERADNETLSEYRERLISSRIGGLVAEPLEQNVIPDEVTAACAFIAPLEDRLYGGYDDINRAEAAAVSSYEILLTLLTSAHPLAGTVTKLLQPVIHKRL